MSWVESVKTRYSELRLQELAKNPRRYLAEKLSRLKNAPALRRLIHGRRVLVLGSGPSAGELDSIPKDVLILTCNNGVKLLSEKHFNRAIDLYYCTATKIGKKDIMGALQKVKTDIFITTNPGQIADHAAFAGSYRRLMSYDNMHKNFARRLYWAKKYRFKNRKTVSAGVRLLQYALYFGAYEIFIIGIDLETSGYFWGGKNRQKHAGVDANFIQAAQKTHGAIYSLSPKSPLARLLPHKDFV
ncbi:MAG: hypothetical protein HYZ52_04295 [Candidatus Omnitrophica bacterium]|nr:hypothetical protein [Candidatus Omnitrophota bacterium]